MDARLLALAVAGVGPKLLFNTTVSECRYTARSWSPIGIRSRSMIDTGSGPPLVLIPGIQGRWEYLAGTVKALATSHRVLTFSLGELVSDDRRDDPFSAWCEGIDQIMKRAGETQATLVGVSFGGLVALRYAARRPDVVRALVLVSTPPPNWRPDARRAAYLRRPRLSLPLFAWRATNTLVRELVRARPSWPQRLRLLAEHCGRALRAPVSPVRMAEWVRAWLAADFESDCRRVTAPTLLVTGEPGFDRVMPMETTLEYLRLIEGARHTVLTGTGHLGTVTKPDDFAGLVNRFLAGRSFDARQAKGA